MTLLITNKTNETEYIKDFATFTDCKDWITAHLDLSLNWFVQQLK